MTNNRLTVAGVMAVALVGVTAATYIILGVLGISAARVELAPVKTITVSGEAKQEEASQVARFNASVSATGDSKEVVDQEMTSKIEALVKAAVDFGIPQENIKTQYYNIYQEEMTDFQREDLTVRRGPWRGNTSVSFEQVPAEQSSEFSRVLVSSGATSIDGPSFALEDQDEFRQELSQQALDNAREKASQLAASQGLKLGPVVSISETGTSPVMPLMRSMGGGGGEAFYPGQQEVGAYLVVTFELQ